MVHLNNDVMGAAFLGMGLRLNTGSIIASCSVAALHFILAGLLTLVVFAAVCEESKAKFTNTLQET